MAVVNHIGALDSSSWDLTADEHHITGNCTLNAATTQTLSPGAVPNPIRWDGNFSITSTTSGRISGTGTAAQPIRWQPNGPATTWYEDNTTRYIYNFGGTGDWVMSYHDMIGCGLFFNPSAGTNAINNLRVAYGTFAPSVACLGLWLAGGINTITDIQCLGNSFVGMTSTVVAVSAGTNVVRGIYVDGGTLGIAMNVTGGTNTFSDFKIVRAITPISFAGTAPINITNLACIFCKNGLSGTPGATSTITRLFSSIGADVITDISYVFYASIGAGVVVTFDEPYLNADGSGFANISGVGTQARLVVSNAAIASSTNRNPVQAARTFVYRGTSSGNDIVVSSWADGVLRAIELGTSDNDYLVASGAFYGPVPFGAEVFQNWANPNWTQNVDTDSGNTASTSTPPQYGGPLAANRTNARATPNKPLTISSISSGTPTSEAATVMFTTGIKACSRLLIGTSAGVTRANATMVSLWKYHGILDPEMVDFTLPVTSHSHALVNLKANTTYYYVVECYDPCGRRFLSTEQSFATTAAAGGGGSIFGGGVVR